MNPTPCLACQGMCCRTSPGEASPKDFGAPNLETLRLQVRKALESGRWTLDWWEGDARLPKDQEDSLLDRTYFLRPSLRGWEGIPTHASWGGECNFLTPQGCEMEPEDRPFACRSLIPHEDGMGSCFFPPEVLNGYRSVKQRVSVLWIPYQNLLLEEVDTIQECQEYHD